MKCILLISVSKQQQSYQAALFSIPCYAFGCYTSTALTELKQKRLSRFIATRRGLRKKEMTTIYKSLRRLTSHKLRILHPQTPSI